MAGRRALSMRRLRPWWLLVVAPWLLAGAAPTVDGPIALGGTEQAMRVGHVWIAGLLDPQALERARAGGVRTVINLRDPAEPGWEEERAAAALGLRYRNVPVAKEQPFDRAALDRISALVAAHPDEDVIVHCSTGNRAAAWLATHLVATDGLDVEEAVALARRAGMTRPEVEVKLRALLTPPTPGADAHRTEP